ncbi:hypothetical protein BJD99_04395 [Rhodococcus sp. 1163]|uniref:DUF2309 domain-containing protein n=1 Tax=unclassified Rhodococcus (in: high G+C Gram-positive bacteria) TaxID=192944 RepID=UPI000A028810|nr:DUF2309 domain-containing protein [Rhodococcus sp. 1163]ORI19434.1 hypothetical protein BJD99_04395 [Rhodococcus sp. 1163]
MTAAVDHSSSRIRRAKLRAEVALAARVLPTHYPVETFIAVNPLAGLAKMPFEQATHRAGDLYGAQATLPEQTFRVLYRDGRITDADIEGVLQRRFPGVMDGPRVQLGPEFPTPGQLLRDDLLYGIPSPDPLRSNRTRSEMHKPAVADTVDTQTAKWCSAFLGSTTAGWPMPGRENGFFAAWHELAHRDHTLPRHVRATLRKLPFRADDAALSALDMLGVDDDSRALYMQAHLTRLPGWAAHVRWCSERGVGIDVVDYLAMRLSYEAILLGGSGQGVTHDSTIATESETPSARQRSETLVQAWGIANVTDAQLAAAGRILTVLPLTARTAIWQDAYEAHYRDALLDDLQNTPEAPASDPVHVQMVCCIDTRSEGLRRHLEELDGYRTLGFAGFFAAAIRFTDLAGGASRDLCPVLISPNHDVGEHPATHALPAAARRVAGLSTLTAADASFHSAKDSAVAPFTLAEIAGWVAGPWAATKTLAPTASAAVRRRVRHLIAPRASTVISVDDTIALDQQVGIAHAALATMGFTTGFARLVVMCAHGSQTENNPYQAALDCGACGGQPGAPTARTAAAILNSHAVRNELHNYGIDIGDDTYFIAAQHNTTTDRVVVLDTHLVPNSHRDDLARLTADLDIVSSALAVERCTALPGAPKTPSPTEAARHVRTRAADWAQVYPEWGLASNAAFIIGPRTSTRGIDLHRRAFLHSYDAATDPDGTALETILTAPLVVAQWINSQYYFSTVAPRAFGAGTKTIHNVIAGVGVLAGHGGDLQLGLPQQSLTHEGLLVHEPMRLMAIVEAPLANITTIIARNPMLQDLVDNEWIALAAREHTRQPWQRHTRTGWRRWDEHSTTPIPHEQETTR